MADPAEAVKANRSPTIPATSSTQLLNNKIHAKYHITPIEIIGNFFILKSANTTNPIYKKIENQTTNVSNPVVFILENP